MTDGLIEIKPKKSIAVLAREFGELCDKIDQADEIEEGVVENFMAVKGELSDKVDVWIYKLDQGKSWTQFIKDRKKRVEKGYKFAQNIEKRMKSYIKYQLENATVPFKGLEGTIYLHGNAEKVDHTIKTENKTVHNAIDESVLDLVPDINPYVKTKSFHFLDVTKVKEDLKAGKKLSFAKITKGSHVRVRS